VSRDRAASGWRLRPASGLFVALTLLGACAYQTGTQGLAPFPGADSPDVDLDAEIVALQSAIEEALVWRVKAAEAYPQLKERSDRGALSSADLYWLYGGAESYFELRDRLLPYTQPYVARFATEIVEPPLGTPAGQLMMKKIKLNLAVGLVLYDNYLIGVYPFTTRTPSSAVSSVGTAPLWRVGSVTSPRAMSTTGSVSRRRTRLHGC